MALTSAEDGVPAGLCSICDLTLGTYTRLLCFHCLSVPYCSNACQQEDWPTHKLLCTSIGRSLHRPEGANRAILFPVDELQPKFIWLKPERFRLTLPPRERSTGGRECLLVQYNYLRNRNIGHTIVLLLHQSSVVAEGPINRSIREITEGRSTSFNWRGPVVVLRMESLDLSLDHPIFCDMTLADFRHTIDIFLTYNHNLCAAVSTQNGLSDGLVACKYGIIWMKWLSED